jgi:primosomal replication protein N
LNRFELVAEVVERQAVRMTPAGLAVLSLTLSHRSSQIEAGSPRELALEVQALGIGAIAERLQALQLGQTFCFTGFIANKTRSIRSLIFHITDIEEFRKD